MMLQSDTQLPEWSECQLMFADGTATALSEFIRTYEPVQSTSPGDTAADDWRKALSAVINTITTAMRDACVEKVNEMRGERLKDLHAFENDDNHKDEADYERAVVFVLTNAVTALESLTLEQVKLINSRVSANGVAPTVDGTSIDARLDRAYIAGAKFGWNCAEAGNAKLFNDAIRARYADISTATTAGPVEQSDRLRAALEDIASQRLRSEIEPVDGEISGDFEGAYDTMINVARDALAPAPLQEEPGGSATDNNAQ